MIKVSSTKIKINEEASWNAVSIDRAAPVPPTTQSDNSYDKPVKKWDDEIDEGEKQIIAQDLADAPREYAVDCIVGHVGERNNIGYVGRRYGFTSAEETAN